jgi:5-methylcytosine-specific restriction endonuclease McrA
MGTIQKDMKGIICFADINYQCPYCGNVDSDDDDKLLNRCNKNKSFWTKVWCYQCGERFGFTYDYTGKARTFKI